MFFSTSKATLEEMLNALVESEEPMQYTFSLNENTIEVTQNLFAAIEALQKSESGFSTENTLKIQYFPLSVFRVRPVTRCTSTMTGHSDAVLCVAFSPDCTTLATSSGDTTVRLWDMGSDMPKKTLTGHKNWVQIVSWSPDNVFLASAGMDKSIRIWSSEGNEIGVLNGHNKPVTALAWQPMHSLKNAEDDLMLASCSQDKTIRLWEPRTGALLKVFSSHTNTISCLRWTGEGYLISGGRDRNIFVWNPEVGTLVKDLKGHAHWVNYMCMSTDHVLKSGPFCLDGDNTFSSRQEMVEKSKERYEECVKSVGGERMLSCSDDNTMYLWQPAASSKPLMRLTGHQKPVNHASFSPDGRFIVSASFDKSLRLWDGRTGKFVHVFRGHVAEVYQVCWSADSRMILSASRDSTAKVWDCSKKKLKEDLPGHADEVYAVDWALDGSKAATGSKDRSVKIWRH